MAKCETCGNDYDKAFQITIRGETHIFDSFECAIQGVAPRCVQCDCPIIGHGLEEDGEMFCCANCAKESGKRDLKDRG